MKTLKNSSQTLIALLILLLPINHLYAAKPSPSPSLRVIDEAQLETALHQELIKGVKINIYKNRGAPRRHPLSRPVPRPAPRPAARAQAGVSSIVSSTNVRERGVDEADLVKTDGRYLYAINNANNPNHASGIRIMDIHQGGLQPKQVSALGFGKGIHLRGIYLQARQQRLVVLGSSEQGVNVSQPGYYPSTHLMVIDIRNKTQPRVLRHIRMDGQQKTTRLIGNQLYLVLTRHLALPSNFRYVHHPLNEAQMTQERQKLADEIRQWRIKPKLPHYFEYGKRGTRPLVFGDRYYWDSQQFNTSDQLNVLLAINLSAPDFRFNSLAYLGDHYGASYASTRALYLAGPYHKDRKKHTAYFHHHRPINQQVIHKFAFQGKGFGYRGSGVVMGRFGWNELSTFQMDENKHGHLRVVTNNAQQSQQSSDPLSRSPVILSILAEQPNQKRLTLLSQLPNKQQPKPLGKPGERLYGARLFNDYAYFVTFRQTDPLYVVDLRNSRRPRVTGELVIPGFSDYLHPIGKHLLLGIGQQADNNGRTQGVKLSLFNISNPQRPREVHNIKIAGTGSSTPVIRDYHALTTLAVHQAGLTRIALPVVAGYRGNAGNNGLHRFEVDHRKQRLRQLGVSQAPQMRANRWHWADGDRSIMIANRLFYYHRGQFWAQPWKLSQR